MFSVSDKLYLTRYHVPRSWFKPSGNVLVIFEEKGGDPTKIQFSKRIFSGVCSSIAEDYPLVEHEFPSENGKGDNNVATVLLKCPKNTHISNVKFASFGTPTGTCGSYSKGDCHDPNSSSVVEKVVTVLLLVFPYSNIIDIYKNSYSFSSKKESRGFCFFSSYSGLPS